MMYVEARLGNVTLGIMEAFKVGYCSVETRLGLM